MDKDLFNFIGFTIAVAASAVRAIKRFRTLEEYNSKSESLNKE